MKFWPFIIAGLAYFALGGLWFTPLFGKHWDCAVGFERPQKWRPAAPYYFVPLIGCLIAAFCTAYLIHIAHAQSIIEFLQVGCTVGLGYGAVITSINAFSPNMPRPWLYATVVGSYHLLGLTLCSAILYGLR